MIYLMFRKYFIKKQLKGFLLLEAAIAILIVGCLSSIVFPMIKTLSYYQKSCKTQQAIERTFRCLASYALIYNRLPKPSCDPSHDGEETASNTTIGNIPYKTLCIEKNIAQDGNGNVLYYIVNPVLTYWIANNQLEEESFFRKIKDPSHHLQIIANKQLVTPKPDEDQNDFCAAALISIPPSSEISLASLVLKKDSRTIIQIPPKETGVIIRWVSRNNLNALYGSS